MLFTLVAALTASQSAALRPEVSRSRVSQNILQLGRLVSDASKATESLSALRSATRIMDDILAQNATEHISDDDAALLKSVIELVETTIYGSMDSAHVADEAALGAGVAAVAQCNADIAARQAPTGDLGVLYQGVVAKQSELDRLQGVVDEKASANASAWEAFDNHMQMIANPPACPAFPARTMPSLDVYFEKSEYSIWFAHQQEQYQAARESWVDADAALDAALEAYNIQKAVRDVAYCDWKDELESACDLFDECYASTSEDYNKNLVPRVQADMEDRIEAFKAGETLVHQIKFLLGDVATQETPAIVTSRYEIDIPSLPPKGVCDLEPLSSSIWVPTVSCDAPVCQFESELDDSVMFTPHCHPPNFHPVCSEANEGLNYYAFGQGSNRRAEPLVDVGGGDAQKLSGCNKGWLFHNKKKAALKFTCKCSRPVTPDYESRPTNLDFAECANYKDSLPGKPLGTDSHTVIMEIEVKPAAVSAPKRQWILNIGQITTGANHWLWNANSAIDAIQFGAYNGAQIQKADISTGHTLATTFDGTTNTYSLYVDGVFHSSRSVPLNIQNGEMHVGIRPSQWTSNLDFQGCVRGVDVYRSHLTSHQVALASKNIHQAVAPKNCQWVESNVDGVTFRPHCHPPNFHATCNVASEGKHYFGFGRGSARKTHPMVDVGGGDAQQLSPTCDGGWLHHNAKTAALKFTCTC